MTCEEMTEFLSRYVDGELGDEERKVFEEHLGACPPCVVYLDSFRDTIRMGKEVSCPEAQDTMPENLVKAILAAREAAKSEGGS